ncbi:MAG: hypothetical protein M1831_002379 [Alyxoria varia]|nr:MAG: hypothetical protein M1831_002379 [Alyxoria varia]
MAAPLTKRQQQPLSEMDISVLQLAHYLENLEYNLYSGGYSNFTEEEYQSAGFEAGFRENVNVIAQHEATHRDTLAQVLEMGGQTPLPECTYSFPYSDPKSFVDLSNMITSVGIGAYIGGSTMLTDNAKLLEAAGSIVTVEARHDAYLRAGVGGSPFPNSFDTAITALWAYNLAHMFIVSCPQELPGVTLLPKLTLESPMPPPNLQPPTPAGTTLTFSYDPSTFFTHVAPEDPLYIAFINQVSDPKFEKVAASPGEGGLTTATVPLPEGVEGVAFAVLTTFEGGLNATQLSEFGTLAGPAEVVAG